MKNSFNSNEGNLKIFCLFLFTISIFASSFADLVQQEMSMNLPNIAWIMNHYQDEWKASEIDNRIYFKEEAIIFIDDNFFILVDPYLILADRVQYDSVGYYICHEGYCSWECCKCHNWNSKHSNSCQNCYAPRCN